MIRETDKRKPSSSLRMIHNFPRPSSYVSLVFVALIASMMAERRVTIAAAELNQPGEQQQQLLTATDQAQDEAANNQSGARKELARSAHSRRMLAPEAKLELMIEKARNVPQELDRLGERFQEAWQKFKDLLRSKGARPIPTERS